MKIPSLTALTCQEVVELVSDYLSGDMTPEDTARLEQHFHACTWCAVYLDQVRFTSKAVRELAGDPGAASPADDTRARLLARFRRMRDSS